MSDSASVSNYPGLDRLNYFFGNVGMVLAVAFAVMIFGPDSGVMKYLPLPLMVVSLVLDVMRLRNVGLSQWFAFVRFVPFGNTILGIFLFSAQPGWAETRRWDRAGRTILIVECSLLVLMIFMYFRLRPSVPVSYWDLFAQ